MKKINIKKEMNKISSLWESLVIGKVNSQDLKILKIKGENDWHTHDSYDELIYVVSGELTIFLENDKILLNTGELYIITQRLLHKVVSTIETDILIIEKN